MDSNEINASPGALSRSMQFLASCVPWSLTAGVGVWQWHRLSTSGDELRYVVAFAVVLCIGIILMIAFRTIRPARRSRHDILTVSGHYFDFLHPERCKFGIEEIGFALSHVCRFTGHTRTHYSVAQHSVLASYLVPREHALAALLHDASEAFIGDMSEPLKQLCRDYQIIERRIESEIFRRFGLAATLPREVKHIDRVLLATEQRDLMPAHDNVWELIEDVEPLTETIVPWTAECARQRFYARYTELTGVPVLEQFLAPASDRDAEKKVEACLVV